MELSIPYTPSGSYTFVSQATKQIINLSILGIGTAAIGQLAWTGTLQFHQARKPFHLKRRQFRTRRYMHTEKVTFPISIKIREVMMLLEGWRRNCRGR